MDVRALRHFTAIIRHRNLHQAAAALGLTQPALSQSVRRLEAELSVRLLERGRFGTVPTPIGEVFAAHAVLILSDFERAHSEVDALRGARAGSVVIGTGPSEASRLLPLALGRLLARRPDISVSVTYGMNEQLMPAVRKGEIEFALSSIPRIRQDDELRHEPIWHDRACVIARSGHPLTRKRKLRLADLLRFPWIQGRRQEYERRAMEEMFLAAGLPAPRMAIETTSITLIKAMVAETDYLTFAPRQSIHYEERGGVLTALSIGSGLWKRTVGITYRHNARFTPASRVLITELKSVGAQLARETAGEPRVRSR